MKRETPVNELQSLFSAYDEKLKLIDEHIERVEKGIDKILKKITSGREPLLCPTIIKEIIEALQLDPNPIDGKYRPASGNYKQFVYWIVDNKYDEYLTPDNFFTFIHCTIKEEHIKKYFREAKPD